MCFTFLLQRYRWRVVENHALKTKGMTDLQPHGAGDAKLGRTAGTPEGFQYALSEFERRRKINTTQFNMAKWKVGRISGNKRPQHCRIKNNYFM